MQRAFDLLSLPTTMQADGDKVIAFMEFVDGAEWPKNITQEELEDWLERVKEASMEFGIDIGEDDQSLDNLIRYQGKLYWCDGNLMGAKSVDSQKAVEFITKQRYSLSRFVKQ